MYNLVKYISKYNQFKKNDIFMLSQTYYVYIESPPFMKSQPPYSL